jgi:hypothetical protein
MKQLSIFIVIFFLAINAFSQDNTVTYKKYQIILDNNEIALMYFLSKNDIAYELTSNAWKLIYETKGHFWKFLEMDEKYLLILLNGQGILTENRRVLELGMSYELIIFDSTDINNISYYYILRGEQLDNFIKRNELTEIELYFEGIDPSFSKYYELSDGRFLEKDVGSMLGFVFMDKKMMDNWNRLIYDNDFSVIIIPE